MIRTRRVSLSTPVALSSAVLMMALLNGCLTQSLQPLYDATTVTFDERLLGSWRDGDSVWLFEAEGARSYRLTLSEEEEPLETETHLVRLDDRLFLDIYVDRPPDDTNEILGVLLLPVHTILRVDQMDDRLVLSSLDMNWWKQEREELSGVAHAFVDDRLLLTGRTDALQAFFAEHGGNEEAWEEVVTMRAYRGSAAKPISDALWGVDAAFICTHGARNGTNREFCSSLLVLEGGKEVAELFVDVGRVVEGAGHLFAEHRAETLAQAMHRHLHRPLGHAQAFGDIFVPDVLAFAGEESLQQLEALVGIALTALGAHALENVFELRRGPAAIEFLLGGSLVGRLDVIPALGGLEVERQRRGGAAALVRLLPVPLVGGIVLQRGEQERAETPALAIRRLDVVLFEQLGEEPLNQVFGLLLRIPAPAQVGVQRVPVRLAQVGERRARVGVLRIARGDDQCPLRSFKAQRVPPSVSRLRAAVCAQPTA